MGAGEEIEEGKDALQCPRLLGPTQYSTSSYEVPVPGSSYNGVNISEYELVPGIMIRSFVRSFVQRIQRGCIQPAANDVGIMKHLSFRQSTPLLWYVDRYVRIMTTRLENGLRSYRV